MFGICYGAQLLAHAFGGAVRRSATPEIGWYEVDSEIPDVIATGPWLQWHYDVVDVPPGATRLAVSPSAPRPSASSAWRHAVPPRGDRDDAAPVVGRVRGRRTAPVRLVARGVARAVPHRRPVERTGSRTNRRLVPRDDWLTGAKFGAMSTVRAEPGPIGEVTGRRGPSMRPSAYVQERLAATVFVMHTSDEWLLDSPSPGEVANAEFQIVRRGYDPLEVQAFARAVSTELLRLGTENQALRQQVELLESRVATGLDEQSIAQFLGEETTRLLTAARDTAAGVVSRAEQKAAGRRSKRSTMLAASAPRPMPMPPPSGGRRRTARSR